MKRLAIILSVFGVGFLCAGLIAKIVPFDPFALESLLASDGAFDLPIMHAFRGMETGLLMAGLALLLLAAVFYLCERRVINIYQWSERKFLLTIISVKIILILACILFAPYVPTMHDDTAYYQYSQSFASGSPIERPDGRPTAWWPIGYPLYLSIFFRIFGPEIWAGQIANALLLTGITLLTYLLGRGLFGTETARGAALVVTLTPSQTFYTIILLSDILFAFLVLALIYLTQRKATLLNTILIGICFGAATLTRTVIFFFPLVILIYWILRDKRWKPALLRLLLIGIIGEAVLLPWQIRNYRAFGSFVLSTTNGGIHFWMGNNPNASGGFIPGHFYIPREDNEWLETLSEVEIDRYAFKQGLTYVLSHPAQTVLIWPKKLLYLFSKESRCVTWSFAGTYKQISPSIMMGMVVVTESFFFILGLSFVISAIHLIRRDKISPRVWLLGAPILYFIVVYLAFIAEGRYHLPLIPIFVIVATMMYSDVETSAVK